MPSSLHTLTPPLISHQASKLIDARTYMFAVWADHNHEDVAVETVTQETPMPLAVTQIQLQRAKSELSALSRGRALSVCNSSRQEAFLSFFAGSSRFGSSEAISSNASLTPRSATPVGGSSGVIPGSEASESGDMGGSTSAARFLRKGGGGSVGRVLSRAGEGQTRLVRMPSNSKSRHTFSFLSEWMDSF